jgi:uncharacterized membrane protein
MSAALQDITHTIQLAVAPVFLLTAIGTTLNVLASRLGRVIDRARFVETELKDVQRPPKVAELDQLARRAKLVMFALTAGVVAAFLVCLLIGLAFLAYLFAVNLAPVVAVLFVLAVSAFMVALVFFLREVFLAIAMLKFSLPPEVKA